MTFHIILYQPEIPPNTGNIIRLAANTGCRLHLIEPLSFELTEKQVRRAGLDYHHLTHVSTYPNLNACLKEVDLKNVYACSTKGKTSYSDVQYKSGDAFLFGQETRGLPEQILHDFGPKKTITIPMLANSRSLNLANAVGIIVYEAWRQNHFECS